MDDGSATDPSGAGWASEGGQEEWEGQWPSEHGALSEEWADQGAQPEAYGGEWEHTSAEGWEAAAETPGTVAGGDDAEPQTAGEMYDSVIADLVAENPEYAELLEDEGFAAELRALVAQEMATA